MNFKINNSVVEIPEAQSIVINQIVYDKKSKGERVYTFSLGEAFFEIPKFEITDEEFFSGYHYSSSMGVLPLREKIANLYKKEYESEINPENEILISAGSKVIIYMLLKLIINDGEEVIVPEPAWLSYKEQIKLVGGKHVPIPYDKPVKEWEKYITPKTKMIIINNPNNPSGQLYTKEELNLLLEFAKKYNIFILSDEAYSDFLCFDNKFISFANIDKDKQHSLIVNSLSKNMGMSGWRVGYAICHKDIIKNLLKLNQHIITCAPTILQNYMAKYFNDILSYTLPQAKKMAEKRFEVQKILDKVGIKSLKGVGTFYFLLNVEDFKGTTEELVYDLLINHNIATVAGSAYGESTSNFIRFGIGVESLEDIEKNLVIIKKLLDLDYYNNSDIKQKIKDFIK